MKVAIAGAGLSGATVAERLRADGHDVTVYDTRGHIAGNAFDYLVSGDAPGVRIHKYGPHIFHTKNENVYKYLQRFTKFIPYEHRVTAMTDRGYVPFPPNRTTMVKFAPNELIDTFYRPYTELMWDEPLEKVSPKILDRVPMREDNEDRYFPNDPFQGMPEDGYHKMVERMLDGCNMKIGCKFEKTDFGKYDEVFYCGSPDTLLDCSVGTLPYRTIEFDMQLRKPKEGERYVLPTATVNFSGDILRLMGYTRVTEWSRFTNSGGKSSHGYSHLTFERPSKCYHEDHRYYPVRNEKSLRLYDVYVEAAKNRFRNIHFIGRCGNFVYIDMDQAVNMGLMAANKMLKKDS